MARHEAALGALPPDVLAEVVSFLPPTAIARLSMTTRGLHGALSVDAVWKPVCERFGFQHQSKTRTRGQKPWREVYIAHLCVECRREGSLAISAPHIFGGASDSVWLCRPCFGAVQGLKTHTQRMQQGLPRIKAGQGLVPSCRQMQLLAQIPEKKSKRKRTNAISY